ncbi:amino acid adenylation domain-containing protein [Xanthobacteraceae bacterium A53D]
MNLHTANGGAPDETLRSLLDVGAIAIVGVAGRFPGAASVEDFWDNLKRGADSVSHFAPEALDDSFGPQVRDDADYVPARPVLPDVERFDAPFFGMHAREAALTDPQHRILLECAWEGLEDAGHDPAAFAGAIGVFAGCSMNTYFLRHVCRDRQVIEDFTNAFQVGKYPMLVGAGHDFLATRIAYKLDLHGPAVTVASACSTSLLAVAQAAQSLQTYQCDMALAGGVSISFPQHRGYLHQAGGMVSPDGRCRPFDAAAGGTVFGSGAGLVVLRRLEDALADGDQIYAVIRGYAVNNDGSGKVGFTSPSVDWQARVIAAAHRQAGISADSIGYVEAHGTATPLGDPIEFAGLCKAFRATTERTGFCALGSAKANVGHLDAAAGVIGLIKSALVLRHGAIPPLAHFVAPNCAIDLAASPFHINRDILPWPQGDTPRRTGNSAFGVGGTNVHVVLEEAPNVAPHRTEAAERPFIFPLSARSATALAAARAALADHVARHPDQSLADVSHTLQSGRRAFDHRCAVTARTAGELAGKLRAGAAAVGAEGGRPIVFLFPGQGAQARNMGRGLYDSEPLFRALVDQGASAMAEVTGTDIRDLLFADAEPEGENPLDRTVNTQPALFLIEYATARLLMSWGIQPDAMAGHSMGELVAATLAGVFDFEDAARAVAERGKLMYAQPRGIMLSVRLPAEELAALLPVGVDVAAINSPRNCVVSGPKAAIAGLEALLTAKGIAHQVLPTTHAFHSAMMEPVVEELSARFAELPAGPPDIPYISCISGTWASAAEAADPAYWGRQCRAPVAFARALETLGTLDRPILLEVGPGQTLTTFARRVLGKDQYAAVLTTLGACEDDAAQMRDALGALWSFGAVPDWPALAERGAGRISLPTYPFQRERHWIEPPPPFAEMQAPPASHPVSHPIVETVIMGSQQTFAPTPSATDTSGHTAISAQVAAILEDLSGESLGAGDMGTPFLELGFDSLFLAQVATKVQQVFKLPLTFRQLMGDLSSVDALSAHLAIHATALPAAPAPAAMVAAPAPVAMAVPVAAPVAGVIPTAPVAGGGDISSLLRMQLDVMQQVINQQMVLLQGGQPVPAFAAQPVAPAAAAPVSSAPAKAEAEGPADTGGRFQVYRGAKGPAGALTDAQSAFIADLGARMSARAKGSKDYTQAHRPVLADPRAAAGFRAEWKDLVFPVVAARAKGPRIWDVDGNAYIDLVNGYGQTAFGHAPDFVVEAVSAQLAEGFAIGPQSPLAGEVASLIAELTGNERVTFCNTGSEAVMAAMRVARTVTGRDRVVMFGGGYHGQFDEVLVKGGRAGATALPVAPGIPRGSVGNMIVLPFGTPESLDWVRANADTLAAVITEPVQSRHPGLVPVDFLRELRAVTERSGTAFVMDEVVTGFRTHPGGMQAVLGLRADLATYGKVVGGGLPIGVLAGSARFMDALDGGQWRYGDDSVPEVAPTFFAGTFVRHPLVLAAARAVLTHLKAAGPELQSGLAARTAALVAGINGHLERRGIATRAETYSSWFYLNFSEEDRLGGLFFHQARSLGLNIQEGFPAFLTTTHGGEEMAEIDRIVGESLDALQAAGILSGSGDGPPPGRAPKPFAEALPERIAPTEPQREIWLAAQGGDEMSCAFNESVSVRFDAPVGGARLERALQAVVQRHEGLRGRFDRSGAFFEIDPDFALDLARVDFSGADDPEAALAGLLGEDAATPFDLVNGPLVRASHVMLAGDASVLVITAHHIVCDGWSINILLQELSQLYEADGGGAGLPEALPFRRYALDQAASSAASADSERYWLGQYADLPPEADLPTDRPRPQMKTFAGDTCTGAIDADLYRAVKKAGGRAGATLFSTLASAFQIVLWRLTGQADQVLAIPTAGQSRVEGEAPLVGHCVNFLPLRTRIDPDAPAAQMLKGVQKAMMDLNDHPHFTFGTLVRKLNIMRNPSRLPLTQVQFNLERLGSALPFGTATGSVAANAKAFTNFDLFLNVIESETGLRLECDYNTDLFDRETVVRWLGHFEEALRALVADMARPVRDLPILSSVELDWIARQLNDTTHAGLDLRPLPDLVREQACGRPDAVAVRWRERVLTYGELDAASDALARHLRLHVPDAGGRIAILAARSPELIVGLLAIMKAGHAFVPLDPDHPDARLRLTIEGARLDAMLGDDIRAATLAPDIPFIDLEVPPATAPGTLPDLRADDSAYVIFTSGSTGKPKGVEISHASVANLLWSFAERPGFAAGDTLLAVTTVTFDIAVLELFLPLVTGGTVIVADREEVQGGFGLAASIARLRPSHLQATPSLWRMLLEAGFKPYAGLKMLCGGEPLPRDLAAALTEGEGELWNVYGPTETTIWSSAGRVMPDEAVITIGDPVLNTSLHVLDDSGQIAPLGRAGELVIGGLGLAKGYFDRPALTSAAFRESAPGGGAPATFYHTGDLARRLADGRIQHLGRRDLQIKLRGHRIELEDIECAARTLARVADAAVTLKGADANARLVGYYVAQAGATVRAEAVQAHVRERLPVYMLPTLWIALDALPRTANGKLDRKALPEPELARVPPEHVPVRPRTETETILAGIWGEVLGIPDVGVEDNLFALGADSLHVFRIAARMLDRGLGLEARHLMQHPTIAELARVAEQMAEGGGTASAVPSLRAFRRAPAGQTGAGR